MKRRQAGSCNDRLISAYNQPPAVRAAIPGGEANETKDAVDPVPGERSVARDRRCGAWQEGQEEQEGHLLPMLANDKCQR